MLHRCLMAKVHELRQVEPIKSTGALPTIVGPLDPVDHEEAFVASAPIRNMGPPKSAEWGSPILGEALWQS